ncbi:MAG: hypothetical protein ACIRZ4_07185 [Limosilactobacillus mucosae]
MESKIIEIFGIPGSGKTYYTEKIIKDNPQYFDFSKYLFSRTGNLYFKIFVHLRLSYLYEYKLTKQVITIMKPYLKNENVFGFNVKLINYVYQLIYLYHVKKKYLNKNVDVIFDEGIVHHLIGIEAEFNVPHDILISVYNILNSIDLKKQTQNIFIDVPINTAFKRIRMRNRKFSSMDYLNDTKLMTFLKNYHLACIKYGNDLPEVKLIKND